jgi:hypothetical protein
MSSIITGTFTVTNAEYLASKIAADLKQMQMFYANPSDSDIECYVKELVIFLKGGYVSSVDYGFIKNEKWVLAVSYSVNPVTGQLIDNNPGRIPAGKDISGTHFTSHLRYASKFFVLSAEEQQKIKASAPVKRSPASDPQTGLYGVQDRTYSSGGQQVNRQIFS